jgi:hypothetical protein
VAAKLEEALLEAAEGEVLLEAAKDEVELVIAAGELEAEEDSNRDCRYRDAR